MNEAMRAKWLNLMLHFALLLPEQRNEIPRIGTEHTALAFTVIQLRRDGLQYIDCEKSISIFKSR